ncbi:7683_t:CDS:2 [Ambispora leptoticha]|uniref:Acyl-coenzyme A oxidase n=1 Tax=Ambispora leptoticha TaxID=144679 RepID=A0A9N8ZZL6_9GLOM|nr:7683_t:CDS:2 [Ambispora leptoticha]
MTSYIKIPQNLKPADPQGSEILAVERAKAVFNVKDLTLFIYGEEFLDIMHRVLPLLENDPIFDKSELYYMGRTELFKKALACEKRLAVLTKEYKWGSKEVQLASWLIDIPGPFNVHKSMFIPTLESQGTKEQREKFMIPAKNFEIIGCYAQTELGHGSNVQGLETTATYIPETKEFEIHSPTLTASKWWVGNLGAAANHAVVMARLVTNGKDYGPHPFIVPIRDVKTHKPLPGITVGDVGPKFGFNSVDNGFVLFDHVRIPHLNMLANFAKVEPNTGNYIKPPNDKLSYGTMVLVRTKILLGARYTLARAATIAIRYSVVRRQSVDQENPTKLPDGRIIETAVIDYTMQQYRLFPVVAMSYAFSFTADELMRLYEENQEKTYKGDFSLMADLHATSSGLKALSTSVAADAIEDCRRSCGGHGFSSFSGFTHFYQNFLPNVTWEGDNYILTQQTARYLFKNYRQLLDSKDSDSRPSNPTIAYIQQYMRNPNQVCPAIEASDFNNPEIQLTAFAHRAAYLIANAVDQIDKHNRTWNSMLVEIYNISRAHCQYILVRNFIAALQTTNPNNGDTTRQKQLKSNPSLRTVLVTVCNLFALSTMEKEVGEFMMSGYLTSQQATLLKAQVLALLVELRPNILSLVDAFYIPDFLLHSALGRADGRVYETMLEWAVKEPLNSVRIDNNIYSSRFLIEGQDDSTLRPKL